MKRNTTHHAIGQNGPAGCLAACLRAGRVFSCMFTGRPVVYLHVYEYEQFPIFSTLQIKLIYR